MKKLIKYRDKKQHIGIILGSTCFIPVFILAFVLNPSILSIILFIISQSLCILSIFLYIQSLENENYILKKKLKNIKGDN